MENGAGDLTFIRSGFEDFCLKLQRMLQLTKEFLLKMYAEWLQLISWEKLEVSGV